MTTTTKLLEIADLKTRLLQVPAGLAQAREALALAVQRVTSLKDDLAEIEAEVQGFVVGETIATTTGKGDVTTKPAFPNDAARKAEVARRLAGEPRARTLAQQLAAAETERLHHSIEVQREEDVLRSLHRLSELTVAEVELLVHGRA